MLPIFPTARHAAAILRGLDDIEKAGPESMRPFDPAVEFFYLHMERALVARVSGLTANGTLGLALGRRRRGRLDDIGRRGFRGRGRVFARAGHLLLQLGDAGTQGVELRLLGFQLRPELLAAGTAGLPFHGA